MNDIRHTAIHEAGHAVIGRVFDLPCGPVTIEPDDDRQSDGHSVVKDPWAAVQAWDERGVYHRGQDVAMRARIMTFMAGRVAEEECLGFCDGGDDGDRHQIDMMLESLFPVDATASEYARYAARVEAMLRACVRRHRAAIERVAALLIERRTLEPDEVDLAIDNLAGRRAG